MPSTQRVESLLKQIYGEKKGAQGLERILPQIASFPQRKKGRTDFFTEEDVILITYGDTLNRPGEAPLKTLVEDAFWSNHRSAIAIASLVGKRSRSKRRLRPSTRRMICCGFTSTTNIRLPFITNSVFARSTIASSTAIQNP